MKNISFLLVLVFSCVQKQDTNIFVSTETASLEIKTSQQNNTSQLDKPYVILVSLDGFRYDYAEKYGAKNLLSFDVNAEKMIPSFPSKTFPNHYALATGLYPGHNGLVSNSFYDRDLDIEYSIRDRGIVENPNFYSGTPIWGLASEHNMVSASMFWVGSEAPIQGNFPTYYYKYNGNISHLDRVNQTIKWLQLPEKERPHLITLYFSIIDDLGHTYGPDSKELAEGVKEIDQVIGDLTQKVDQLKLPVNIIIVSDHGMLEVDNTNVIYLENIIPSDMNVTTSFPAMIYSEDSYRIDSLYQKLTLDTTKFSVYNQSNLPVRYHYDKHLNRIGDLIIMPKPPYTFGKIGKDIIKGSSTHGYDALYSPEMGAIFYAKGPAFKKNLTVNPFENVNIYPLIAKILDLNYNEELIDGKLENVKSVLK